MSASPLGVFQTRPCVILRNARVHVEALRSSSQCYNLVP
jgi:hypothetical protein